MQKTPVDSKEVKVAKNILLALLVLFSAASVVFSLYVLFGDLGGTAPVSPAQSRGLFTVFIYDHINDAQVNPNRPALGKSWQIKSLNFPNQNLAEVEASDGQTTSKLEFIYTIEYPDVRVMKINDVTGRDLQDANLTLVRFLTFLEGGDYENAATLYGGSIARLVPYGTDASSLPKLLEAYCMKETSTPKCLSFSVTNARKDLETGSYTFAVTYQLPDKTAFKLADGTSTFNAIVEATDSIVFKVTSLPFDH